LEAFSIFALTQFNALSLMNSTSSQKSSSNQAWNDHFEKLEKKRQKTINALRN